MIELLKKWIVPVGFFLGGVLFIVLGCIGISQVKRFPQTDATVTSVRRETTYDAEGATETVTVRVSYTVDGTKYDEELQDASGSLKEGETVRVCYDPEKPSYVTAASVTGGLVRLGVGALFAVIGVAVAWKTLQRRV